MELHNGVDSTTLVGLRDPALIGLLVFTFARSGAALGMTVADVYWQDRRLWVRLHEKGGKQHSMLCNHYLENYLQDYIETARLCRRSRGSAVSHGLPAHRHSDRSLHEAVRCVAHAAATRGMREFSIRSLTVFAQSENQ
jgi:integrase